MNAPPPIHKSGIPPVSLGMTRWNFVAIFGIGKLVSLGNRTLQMCYLFIIRLELESESKSSCQYGNFDVGIIFAIDIICCL